MTDLWIDIGCLVAAMALGMAVLYVPGWLADRFSAKQERIAKIRAYKLMPTIHSEFTCPVCCRVMCRDCESGGSHYVNCTYTTLGDPNAR